MSNLSLDKEFKWQLQLTAFDEKNRYLALYSLEQYKVTTLNSISLSRLPYTDSMKISPDLVLGIPYFFSRTSEMWN